MYFNRPLTVLLAGLLQAGMPFAGRAGEAAASSPAAAKLGFKEAIQPLLEKYCYDCHGEGTKKGGLALDVYPDEAALLKDRNTWEHVLNNLRGHVMPPEKKAQPTEAEREMIAAWIESEVFKIDCNRPDPGRVTIRRLNRAEYNNTIRDLVGVNFQPAADFPPDDSGYGFDNIGDVLSLPPVLLEKYLTAAEKILDAAIVTEDPSLPQTKRFAAEALKPAADGELKSTGFSLNKEGEVYVEHEFTAAGEYVLRVKAYGEQAGPESVKMAVRLEGTNVLVTQVTAEESEPQIYEGKFKVEAGKRRVAAAYLNNYFNAAETDPKKRDRNLIVQSFELVGPLNAPARPWPETHRRIFVRQPTPETEMDCAREILARFAKRAYRRPVAGGELDRLLRLFEMAQSGGENFETGIKMALEAVLVSPHFLFRGELQPEPDNPKSVHPVNEFALAARLSYFLWSSMPDDELFAQAERGTLRLKLEGQVRRMLKDPKAKALTDNFVGQWLQIRDLQLARPDWEQFPEFDPALRAAMQKETELFFECVLREDRSALDFLDADYTFVNGRLARHYGLPGVQGDAFQRVSLKGTPRGGVLTHASVLTVTSNPTRTSPVKRGKWVLENLLGTPPPPPPPDVPDLDEKKEAVLSGTLRQRMEQHRDKPMCASCHARMDPIGFGLENFNAIGGWRGKDGKFTVDPSGQLVSGESFNGPAELKAILLKRKKAEFLQCLAGKMLTYALGRGLEFYDKCAVNQIAKGLANHDYKFSGLILEVVKSTPFQMRRGEEAKLADAAH